MMQQKFSKLTMDDVNCLVPGDVLMFYSTEPREIYGVIKKVWTSRMMIFQGKENNFLYFNEADRCSYVNAKIEFFLGKYFAKLDDNQHPKVVKEGYNYAFIEE